MLILPVTFNKNFIEHTNSFLDFDKLSDFTLSLKRSKQSFRFADTPVSLLFEEVPERINFIHKELFRFQGYEELIYFGKLWVLLPLSRRNTKDSANYGQPLHPEVEVGDDNPGHDMPGAGAVTTDPSQSAERDGVHSAKKPHHG
ncbi:hypothetical protein F2Q70_00005189 [Brassica cretica]|uniref:Uncharacterized protein n=1 Tax=Brassica cretica TaxID=69181 RepID=A0A8S9IYP3_BRACR|nr:hypothetical protein F2Q68_00021823 [Brassica cretica]KAF2575210.1 hypothetical protein F2Q70_00005189 [Brassica cretica]